MRKVTISMKLLAHFAIIVSVVKNVESFQQGLTQSNLFGASSRCSERGTWTGSHCKRSAESTKLHSVALTTVATAFDSLCRTSPYAAAGLVCGVKASAADFIAQKRQYHQRGDEDDEIQMNPDGSLSLKKPKTDLKRNFAYIMYGTIYQGIVQEFIYNHVYPSIFGAGTNISTVLVKALFDILVHSTCIALPVAYMSKALIYRYSLREALRRYVDDIKNHGLLKKCYALWGPVQCVTFSIVPEHFRVSFIAMVSFFWLLILSSIASKTPVFDDEECSLVDGQTCNIDG